MVVRQQYNPTQPARVGLLLPLFDDMGIDDYTPEAIEAAYHYFSKYITKAQECDELNECCYSMGDINLATWVFLDAYDAGKTGNTKPEPS